MHPLIAFLTFIFSPASDWTLKNGFTLVLDPQQTPAVVQSYEQMLKHYPSSTKELPETGQSVDDTSLALWAEILHRQGHPQHAYRIWNETLEKDTLEPDIADDIKIRMGEIALRDGRTEKSTEWFASVADRGGARSVDAKINLLISDLSQNELASAKQRAEEIVEEMKSRGANKRATFPLGLLAFMNDDYQGALDHLNQLEDDPKADYFAALSHRHLGQPQQALSRWEQLAKRESGSRWADLSEYQVAETYFSLGDESLSRTACEKALARNVGEAVKSKFVFRLASIDVKQGQYEQALDRLAEISTDDSLANRAMVLAAESMVQTGQSSELLDRLAKNRPKDPTVESTFQTAWASLFDSKHERALEISQTGLENFYHQDYTPRLLLLQGLAYEHLGQTGEALATYHTIADRFHNSLAAAKAIHWTALAYMRKGRENEVLTHVAHLWNRQSEETRQLHPDAGYWLAEANLVLGHHDDADRHYQNFLGSVERDHELLPNAQFQRSITLAKLGRESEALRTLDEFTSTAQEQQKEKWIQLAHTQRGHIHFNDRNFEKAIAHYRASNRNPKSLYYEGLALYRLDYFNDAVDTWTQLASQHEQDSYAEKGLFRAGRTQFELGLSTNAVVTFAQFMETYPDSPQVKDALLQSAHALYNIDRYDEAAPIYARYLDTYQDTIDLVSVTPFLASSYIKMGKTATEIEDLLTGLPRTDVLAELNWEQGAEQYNNKNYEEATTIFANLLAGFPSHEHSANAMFYRGESYFSQEAWFDAETTYNNYLSSFPDETLENGPLALFRRSVSIYNQNRLYEAAQSFEELIETYPENELATNAKENMVLCYYNLGFWDQMNEVKTKYNMPDQIQTPPADTVDKRKIYQSPGFEMMIKERQPSEVAQSNQ